MQNMAERPLFYAPDIAAETRLPESEATHCTRVLRLGVGDEIDVTDGDGHIYRCRIESLGKKLGCGLTILDKEDRPPHWAKSVTVAIAPTKNIDRMEWMIEKLVEIGIDRIVFVRTMRSERKSLRMDRIERVAISAMKQSLKSVLPELITDLSFTDFVAEQSRAEDCCKLIAHCASDLALGERKEAQDWYERLSDTTILIGPEGDFTSEEILLAQKVGFHPLSLGLSRLRTETAAVFALSCIRLLQRLRQP